MKRKRAPEGYPGGFPYPCDDARVGQGVTGSDFAGRIIGCATPPDGKSGSYLFVGGKPVSLARVASAAQGRPGRSDTKPPPPAHRPILQLPAPAVRLPPMPSLAPLPAPMFLPVMRQPEMAGPAWTAPVLKPAPKHPKPRKLKVLGSQKVVDHRLLGWPEKPNADVDLDSYDTIIVAFSGGKDSLACFLYLLWLGVPREKIELWHHDIDGREGSSLMDWPCTRDYCRAIAEAFGVKLYYSWKMGGFEGEMDRLERATAPIAFETDQGVRYTGGKGPLGTRGVFPQVSPDLSVRWCSAYLKIDVGAAAIRNQPRFVGKRTLFLTGERADESASRAHYAKLEPHRADLRKGREPRHVDQWRVVHDWSENQVWSIIAHFRINPHPAYRLGWGRVSCAACIFGSANQFASLYVANPSQFMAVARKEAASGQTIKRVLNLTALASRGTPYQMRQHDIDAACSHVFNEPVILDLWTLPSGAFGESTGPM